MSTLQQQHSSASTPVWQGQLGGRKQQDLEIRQQVTLLSLPLSSPACPGRGIFKGQGLDRARLVYPELKPPQEEKGRKPGGAGRI